MAKHRSGSKVSGSDMTGDGGEERQGKEEVENGEGRPGLKFGCAGRVSDLDNEFALQTRTRSGRDGIYARRRWRLMITSAYQ